MPATLRNIELVGRGRELALVEASLAAARAGAGGALSFSGEPGSGKTALLGAARGLATDFLVVACRGVEWEAELPFSGLHELLGPLLRERGALPNPQREALDGALGLASTGGAQPLNVYAGALSLLAEATRDRPVLILIDDLQWIDSATVHVLSFIARRLSGEALTMLVASRPGTVLPGLDGSPIEVTPLDRAAVGALADCHLGRPLPDDALADLVEASAGNPLAVVESLRHFGEAVGRRGTLLDRPLPVGALIERGFADRLAELTPDALAAVELVAASVSDESSLLFEALGHLGVPPAALAVAERVGALVLEGARVQFVHPLLRALVHRRTDAEQLRRCHAALARAASHETDLRAWHAAGAATVPDEAIAAELDAAAERFVRRGGSLAAAQALARSAELTPSPDAKASRLLRAGSAAHLAGRSPWGMELIDAAVATAVSPGVRLAARFEQAVVGAHLEPTVDLPGRYLAIADDAEGIDINLVADALCGAATEAIVAGQRLQMLEAVARLRSLKGNVQLSPRLSEEVDAAIGVVSVLSGADGEDGEARALLQQTARRRLDIESGAYCYVGESLVWIEDFALSQRFNEHVIRCSRAEGDVFNLSTSLWLDGYRRLRTGDWDGSADALAESQRLAESVDLRVSAMIPWGLKAVLDACRGERAFHAAVADMEALAAGYGFAVLKEYTATALGLSELAAGRPIQAAEHFERARAWTESAGQIEPCVLSWPADLVEAYALAGEEREARAALEQLRERSLRSRRPWALASVARLDGLLADDDEFEAHFVAALSLFADTQAPFDQARAQLAFGQRLRRARRRVDAREHLQQALVEFDRLGAEPWAQQARRELGASTPTLPSTSSQDRSALTPQERQVARLVVGGATNKEVAGAMFLSPKTIETHLSRIYRKLDVSSRTQLAARLRADEALAR